MSGALLSILTYVGGFPSQAGGSGGMDFWMDSPFILGRSSIIYNPLTFPPCLHQAIPTWRHGFSTRLVLVLRDGIPIVPTRLVSVLVLRDGIPIVPTRLVSVLVLRDGNCRRGDKCKCYTF